MKPDGDVVLVLPVSFRGFESGVEVVGSVGNGKIVTIDEKLLRGLVVRVGKSWTRPGQIASFNQFRGLPLA